MERPGCRQELPGRAWRRNDIPVRLGSCLFLPWSEYVDLSHRPDSSGLSPCFASRLLSVPGSMETIGSRSREGELLRDLRNESVCRDGRWSLSFHKQRNRLESSQQLRFPAIWYSFLYLGCARSAIALRSTPVSPLRPPGSRYQCGSEVIHLLLEAPTCGSLHSLHCALAPHFSKRSASAPLACPRWS